MPYLYDLDATHIRNQWYETKKISSFVQQNKIEPNVVSSFSLLESVYEDLKSEYDYITSYKKSWELAPYQPTFVTVDSIVIKSGCILLIKRKFPPAKNKYALAGGFLNPNERIIDGAIRELKEETRIALPIEELVSKVKDVRVFDHPMRSMRGRTITHVHLIDLGYGQLPYVKASDDAKGAFWVPISDIYQMENDFMEDHYDIIVNMVSKF
jgi:bifunctional NMN adenylyltransferase/nudix hydrolase